MPKQITLKQLHAATGELVRAAARSKEPLTITDRGEAIAVLANPSLVRRPARKRVLLPEYEALMSLPAGDDIQAALDEIRGDR